MKLTGAEIFVECLKREGVKTIFGLPGGVVLKIFDVLDQQKDIEVILTRHEAGAGHMAEGYANATGKPGIALVTSRPAMTNVVTPLVDAYMDSVPIKQAVEAIQKARKQIIYVGGGAIFSNAHAELLEFAELTQIPVDMTLMALGAFPGSHALSLGMMGMHGSYASNMAVHFSDLVIAVGARFDDRVTGKVSEFCPEAKVIHIDIDPTSIRKNVHVDIPIVGDVKTVLQELNAMLKATPNGHSIEQRKPWWNQINDWKAKHPLTYVQPPDAMIKPQYVIDRIYQFTKDKDPIVSTDVGQHQMWAAQHFVLNKPHRWLTSGGLGTMGFGMPAALGAQAAFRDKLVLCIAGDGSFQMNMQEMATAVVNKLPVKVLALNNHFHGMLRQWKDLFYEGRYASSYLDTVPDFVKLAEAFNAVGLRAKKVEEVDGVIKEALKTDKPVIVDIEVDPYENCYPMIPAGGCNHQMILQDPPEMKRGEKPVPKVAGEDKDAVLTA